MHVVGPVVGLNTALCLASSRARCLYSRVRACRLSTRRQMNPAFNCRLYFVVIYILTMKGLI